MQATPIRTVTLLPIDKKFFFYCHSVIASLRPCRERGTRQSAEVRMAGFPVIYQALRGRFILLLGFIDGEKRD